MLKILIIQKQLGTDKMNFLECEICMIPYNASNHKPLSLPCGHSICSVAANALYSNNLIKCPVDRKLHSFNKFEDIPPNFGMINIIE